MAFLEVSYQTNQDAAAICQDLLEYGVYSGVRTRRPVCAADTEISRGDTRCLAYPDNQSQALEADINPVSPKTVS